jgi:Ca2+-transporting ATPase
VAGESWYSRSADAVAAALGVDAAAGLSGQDAARRLTANGPNALPEEEPRPALLRA